MRRFLLLAAIWAFAPALPALACACCSDSGDRLVYEADVADYPIAGLEEVAFAPDAHLHLTACGMDCAEGIATDEYAFGVVARPDQRSWTFLFTGAETGAAGSLRLVPPDRAEIFAVDTAPDPGAGMVSLYHEWRMVAPVTGTGIFVALTPGVATAELFLQGRATTASTPSR